MFLNEKIRYPEKGDKLFEEKGSENEIAWLQKMFQEFGSYATGYQFGALKLIDLALGKDQRERDFLVYPIVFLIRHYIELRLKELIQGLNYCIEQDKKFSSGHRIDLLWKEFKSKYKEIGEDVCNEHFKTIDEIIAEMSTIDPISMAFRYPVDKQGNTVQKLEHINLSNLRETFIRMAFVFDGVAMQIAHYVEMTEDMMRDVYYDYYQ